MAELVVTRLLQNPLGQVAPTGQRGDIVRVSDRVAKLYLSPGQFDALNEEALRAMLCEAAPRRVRKPAEPPNTPKAVRPAAATTITNGRPRPSSGAIGPGVKAAGSVTDPRRANRRPQPLW